MIYVWLFFRRNTNCGSHQEKKWCTHSAAFPLQGIKSLFSYDKVLWCCGVFYPDGLIRDVKQRIIITPVTLNIYVDWRHNIHTHMQIVFKLSRDTSRFTTNCVNTICRWIYNNASFAFAFITSATAWRTLRTSKHTTAASGRTRFRRAEKAARLSGGNSGGLSA